MGVPVLTGVPPFELLGPAVAIIKIEANDTTE